MTDQRFTISGSAYSEIVKAVKPHVSRDQARPMLTCVRVRFDGQRAAFEATDAMSIIRATLDPFESVDGTRGDPFDVILPGKHLMSLRPGGLDDVTLRVVNETTSEITCGVVSIRLDHEDPGDRGFPDYDGMLRKGSEEYTKPTGNVDLASGIGFSPQIIARTAGLPHRLMHLRFISPLRPMFFVAQGIARYEGLLMPIRLESGQGVQHEDWNPAPVKKATRKRAA